MADVNKLSHDGFNDRFTQARNQLNLMGFAENVAYNYGHADPTQSAVDGWIKSQGHRENMLKDMNICAVAVYEKDGKWWFTQLFGK